MREPTTPESPSRPIRLPLRVWLWLEMLGLFVLVPGVLAVLMDPLDRAKPVLDPIGLSGLCDLEISQRWLIFPVLFATTAGLLLFLVLSPTFKTSQLWNWTGFRAGLKRVLVLWLLNAAVLLGLTYVLTQHTSVMTEDNLLRLPRNSPKFLLILIFAYPIFSAYPQEITHRAFFFHRYRPLFQGRWTMIAINAVVFMWLHVMFWNWVALVLTLGGGFLFAYTYDKHRSTLLAGLEHGLYGNWIFFTGLGWFVYTGSVGT